LSLAEDTIIAVEARARAALLAAAYGDALGWPFEGRGGRLGRRSRNASPALQGWTRRQGRGRYQHEEVIAPGDYSDDTQLLAASARSILAADFWRSFTRVELPMWLLYERGGGGATLHAARTWLRGGPPWASTLPIGDRQSYFNAGGNGVAMRVAPHVIAAATDEDFAELGRRILTNGVATHGHPRALAGALAYGYALWTALRRSDVLGYGSLIDLVVDGAPEWAGLPLVPETSSWRQAAEDISNERYGEVWAETISEIIDLLKRAKSAMGRGALAFERDFLGEIGALGDQRGSGTISSAAAIFLASRYATAPLQGILEGATAPGADTDTLASLTAALLGTVAGLEWMGELQRQIQDHEYLENLAAALAHRTQSAEPSGDERRVGARDIRRVLEELQKPANTGRIDLPDGRQATIEGSDGLHLRGRVVGNRWRLATADGQTLFVKQLGSIAEEREPVRRRADAGESARQPEEVVERSGRSERAVEPAAGHPMSAYPAVVIPVPRFDELVAFYRAFLAEAVEDDPPGVRIGGAVRLVAAEEMFGDLRPLMLVVPTRKLDALHRSLRRDRGRQATSIVSSGGVRSFVFVDPVGIRVELVERS
jgi:ADP-ribosylglycohydrolase